MHVIQASKNSITYKRSRLPLTPPASQAFLSGIDRFKLEKKRERNRIAASKCRQRKLEKISELGES